MKNNSKKTGVSTSGSIEYTNNVKRVRCKCNQCFRSKKAAGTIYCKYYDVFNPRKISCARYSPKENYGPRAKRGSAPVKAVYTPAFPWEMP